MAAQPWRRTGLELSGTAQPARQRSFDSPVDGQGRRWRVEYQRDAVGARAQDRLGLLRLRSRRPGVGLRAVLDIYRRIEDWHGAPDPDYRGTGGPLFVQPAPDPSPVAHAMVVGARSIGIPTFENQNGRMMEAQVAPPSPTAECGTEIVNSFTALTYSPTWIART